MKHHPDRDGGNDAKFKEITEAYDTLFDTKKRSIYDAGGDPKQQQGGGFNPFGGGFDPFGGSGFNPFGGFGGFNQQRGSDIEYTLKLNLVDILQESHKEIKYNKETLCGECDGNGAQPDDMTQCDSCGGSGVITHTRGIMQSITVCNNCNGRGKLIHKACNSCHGNGTINEQCEITINIPAYIEDNTTSVVPGHGNDVKGGISGNLRIYINIDYGEYTRQQNTLTKTVLVDYSTLVLGGEVDVETLTSTGTLRIQKYTQVGTKLRLRGFGLGNGDLICVVGVKIPTSINDEIESLLIQYATALKDHHQSLDDAGVS